MLTKSNAFRGFHGSSAASLCFETGQFFLFFGLFFFKQTPHRTGKNVPSTPYDGLSMNLS